jgi:hypothetical protein
MFAFDGGAFSLATHEVWALCQSERCSHSRCDGVLASMVDDPDVPAPQIARIRNRRDLTRHLGSRDAETDVVVVPKGLLRGRPTFAHFDGSAVLPSPVLPGQVSASGRTSARQAESMTKFPNGSAEVRQFIDDVVAAPFNEMLGNTGVLRAECARRLELLTQRHGAYHVESAFRMHRADGARNMSVGLAVAATDATLAERSGRERLSRVAQSYSSKKAEKMADNVIVVPSRELAALAPKKGRMVGADLEVHVPVDDTHTQLRFIDRALGMLSSGAAAALASGAAAEPSLVASVNGVRRNLPELVQQLIETGVYSSGVTDSPLGDDALRRIAAVRSRGAKPQVVGNWVMVTCPNPNPSMPDTDLVFIGELSAKGRGASPAAKVRFTPVTVIAKARDSAAVKRGNSRESGPGRVGLNRSSRHVAHRVEVRAPAGATDSFSRADERRVVAALGLDRPVR